MLALIKGSIQKHRRNGAWTVIDDQSWFTTCRLWVIRYRGRPSGKSGQYRRKRPPTVAALLRLTIQSDDEPWAAPELDRTAINQLPGPLDCVGIVIARERSEVDEMPVLSDGISPVIRHPRLATTGRSRNILPLGELQSAHKINALSVRFRTQKSNQDRKGGPTHFLSFRMRSISYLAYLIASARLTGVTPDLFLPDLPLPSENLTSHRQPLPSVNWTTEYSTPLYSMGFLPHQAEREYAKMTAQYVHL
jgi:hypothetical protein